MKTIYKYAIDVTDEQIVKLPANARILTVQVQGGTPCIWALVDTNEVLIEDVTIRVHGTGHPIDDSDNLDYIGTFQMHGGSLVFHVFREIQL